MAQKIFQALSFWGTTPAVLLQILLVARFIRKENRNYPIAIAYVVSLLVLTIGGIYIQIDKELLRLVNYLTFGEIFMHFLLLGLMLQLTYVTLSALALPIHRVWGLSVLSVVILVGSYFVFDATPGNRDVNLFVKIRQVFSFWMVLVNIHWWTLLLRRRILDRRILLLSAGIGLQMTGQVISDGLFALPDANSRPLLLILGVLIMFATHYASLYSWFIAFSSANANAPVVESVPNGLHTKS